MNKKHYPYREKADETLRTLCLEGLAACYDSEIKAEAEKRLEEELELIKKQGSASGYIIVHEMFVNLGIKSEEVSFRGTMASSIVAYVIGLTDIDPVTSVPALYSVFHYGLDGNKDLGFEINVSREVKTKIEKYFRHYPGPETVKRRRLNGFPMGWYIGEVDEKDPFASFYVNIIPDEGFKWIGPDLIAGDIYNVCQPKSFSEFVKCSGLSHGTGTWLGNGEKLLKEDKITLEDLIGDREDVYEHLLHYGVADEMALEIAEYVRKGKARSIGWKDDMLSAMTEAKVPEWFIISCEKIGYLFPRAHDITYMKRYADFIKRWYDSGYDGTTGKTDGIVYNAGYLTRVLSEWEILKEGNLILVGGRPSMGKTAFALSVVDSIGSIRKKRCVIFPLKMQKDKLRERLADVHLASLGKDKTETLLTEEDIKSAKLNVYCGSQTGVEAIVKKSKIIRKQGRIDLIVIDYLQLLPVQSIDGTREEGTKDALRILKRLAEELECSVMVLSQVKRNVERRKDKHPKVTDLCDIKNPFDAADYVIFPYRESYYDKECDLNSAELKIYGKHKEEISLYYDQVRFDGYRFYIR